MKKNKIKRVVQPEKYYSCSGCMFNRPDSLGERCVRPPNLPSCIESDKGIRCYIYVEDK